MTNFYQPWGNRVNERDALLLGRDLPQQEVAHHLTHEGLLITHI